MTDKPRRPWFQLHLSTAIVMMFVAAFLLWLNLNARYVEYELPPTSVAHHFVRDQCFGFPKTSYTIAEHWSVSDLSGRKSESVFVRSWVLKGLAINALSAVAVLLSLAFGMRSFFRRREARAP